MGAAGVAGGEAPSACCRRGRSVGVAMAGLLAFAAGAGFTVPGSAQAGDTAQTPAAAPRATLDLKALLDLDYVAAESDTGDLDAGVEYRISRAVLVRFGHQRLPFGLAAYTGAPSLHTPEFPLATRVLVQRVSVFRDIGLSISGRAAGLEYGAGVLNGAGINVAADNNRARDVLGRASCAVLPGWTVGASGWRGRSGEPYAQDCVPRCAFHDDADCLRWSVASRLARGPLHLAAEYLHDRTEHTPAAIHPAPGGRRLERAGWYALAAFRPIPRLELVGRYDR